MTHERLALGRFGEAKASDWYESNGYQVLERNYRTNRGEIDLICVAGSTVVFVEVKTRTSRRFGGGTDAVDARKQAKIRAVAATWLGSADRPFRDIRFDVVEADSRGNLTVWQAAF